jgi:hypothetical protein
MPPLIPCYFAVNMCLHVLPTMFCSIESIVIEGILRFAVTNWARHSKSAMFEVNAETTFLNFKQWVKSALLKPTEYEFSIYFLPEPNDFITRQKINTIEELRCKIEIVLADESLRSGIYVNVSATSPDTAPCDDDSVLSSLSSNTSSSRGSQQQCFSSSVLKRDRECVFCGHAITANLEAAHIIDVAAGNNVRDLDALLRSCSLLSLYDPENGLTLCKTCHKTFDADLCCVGPDESITVAEAIFSCHDMNFVEHWRKVRGKTMKPPEETYLSKAPNKRALEYRKARFDEYGARRSQARENKPFVCNLCGSRTKSANGLMSHMGSKKCHEAKVKMHLKQLSTPTKSPRNESNRKGTGRGGPTLQHICSKPHLRVANTSSRNKFIFDIKLLRKSWLIISASSGTLGGGSISGRPNPLKLAPPSTLHFNF